MNKKRIDRVAKALGASRVVPLGIKIDHTPLGMAAISDRVRRLQSTGPGGKGRPGDPEATVARLIKLKPALWQRLNDIAAEQATVTGRRVSPAQIASMVLEEALRARRNRRRS